ncbi:hypothetical protein PAXRUDRAFT_20419 [Paxillus rubicundulus Ve08.2h10]|uniref:Uncharacterized protein n=1 Tax=Paxillus rubicundulus Ve08.2h10 TaxID=930991 RepID=A0A0D0CSJ5_9AGAM|nr:hypothetical protein PAXRUDRAFT_20419 [Paxillus rubicundulus Ve08.2h10]
MAWHLPGVLSEEFQVCFQYLLSIGIFLLTLEASLAQDPGGPRRIYSPNPASEVQ